MKDQDQDVATLERFEFKRVGGLAIATLCASLLAVVAVSAGAPAVLLIVVPFAVALLGTLRIAVRPARNPQPDEARPAGPVSKHATSAPVTRSADVGDKDETPAAAGEVAAAPVARLAALLQTCASQPLDVPPSAPAVGKVVDVPTWSILDAATRARHVWLDVRVGEAARDPSSPGHADRSWVLSDDYEVRLQNEVLRVGQRDREGSDGDRPET